MPANVTPITPVEALNLVLDDMAADLRITGARTLANLGAAGRISSVRQTNLDWPVRFDGVSAGILPVETDTTETDPDRTTRAEDRVGFYKVFARRPISRIAIQEALNRAPQDISNLFAEEMGSAVAEIARKINGLIYTGDGTPASGEFSGLTELLDDMAAYAGIDPATWPDWLAIKTDNGGIDRAFTRRLMLDHDVTYGNLERSYDLVIANPAMAAKYQEIYDTLAGDRGLAQRVEQRQLPGADLGHGGRYFNGRPIVEDPTCPTGQILTLHSPDIYLKCFEVDNSPSNPNAISQIAVNRATGLPIHIAELPSSNSLYRHFELYVMPQMQTKNRRAIGGIFDLEA